jgi:hypothetical protein
LLRQRWSIAKRSLWNSERLEFDQAIIEQLIDVPEPWLRKLQGCGAERLQGARLEYDHIVTHDRFMLYQAVSGHCTQIFTRAQALLRLSLNGHLTESPGKRLGL